MVQYCFSAYQAIMGAGGTDTPGYLDQIAKAQDYLTDMVVRLLMSITGNSVRSKAFVLRTAGDPLQ